jgi:pimeloyl-ACP methyl ester carboxylesterase
MTKQLLFATLLFSPMPEIASAQATNAAAPTGPANIASFPGSDDTWQGFARYNFKVAGRDCWVAEPKTPLPGNHWAWCMMFPDAFPERTAAPGLLNKGYYYAFMDVGNTFGSPPALAELSSFYHALTGAALNPKAVLIGISRGGAYACNWAAQNPDKVSVIYGDAPVCNFESWPYAHGRGKDSSDWKDLLRVHDFKTDQEGIDCPTQPIHEVAALVNAHIPFLSVVGDADSTVPYPENTALVEQQYQKLGGEIKVIHKPGCEHHPHGLEDPTPIIDFILQHDAK